MPTLSDSGITLDSEDQRVVVLAINTLGNDAHPWPDGDAILRFDALYVRTCLERALRFAGDVGIGASDVRRVRALIERM